MAAAVICCRSAHARIRAAHARLRIDLALARNDRVVAARDEEQRATIGVRIARAAFNPKVVPSLSSSLGQSDLANQNYGVAVSQQLTSGTEFRFNATTLSSRNQLGAFYTATPRSSCASRCSAASDATPSASR
jgi:outer membrane protein TolC